MATQDEDLQERIDAWLKRTLNRERTHAQAKPAATPAAPQSPEERRRDQPEPVAISQASGPAVDTGELQASDQTPVESRGLDSASVTSVSEGKELGPLGTLPGFASPADLQRQMQQEAVKRQVLAGSQSPVSDSRKDLGLSSVNDVQQMSNGVPSLSIDPPVLAGLMPNRVDTIAENGGNQGILSALTPPETQDDRWTNVRQMSNSIDLAFQQTVVPEIERMGQRLSEQAVEVTRDHVTRTQNEMSVDIRAEIERAAFESRLSERD